MPNDLINNDPLVAQNFFLEIDGNVISMLSGVSGLDVEMEAKEVQQVGKDGKSQMIKLLGSHNKAPDLQLTRLAAQDATADPMWKWFNTIREKGMSYKERDAARKNGSIVLYDSAHTEVSRFNFFHAWPSKIATDALSVDTTDPLKETITLVCERLERIK